MPANSNPITNSLPLNSAPRQSDAASDQQSMSNITHLDQVRADKRAKADKEWQKHLRREARKQDRERDREIARAFDDLENEPDPDIRNNDQGNARRLVMQHGASLRYVKRWKTWLVWTGTHWQKDETGAAMRYAKDTARRIYHEAANVANTADAKQLAHWAMQSESESRLRSMLSLAESELEVARTTDDFDQNEWLFNCRNGTLDLRTGKLKAHDPADAITHYVDVEYDPQATCPNFLSFLDVIMDGNQAMVDFLQRAIGYTLTGDVREECLFIPWGDGSNGKSTLLNIIHDITGAYSRNMRPESLMASRQQSGSAPNGDIARLKGSRFVSAIETDQGQRLNESQLKILTSRDPVTASFKYGDDFEFPPTWKIWLATNHKPVIRGTDGGIRRRLKLIPFTVKFVDPKEHPEAPARLHKNGQMGSLLKQELPGILAWAVKGCLIWQRDELDIPQKVKQATSEYFDEMDVIGAFLGETCITGASYKTSYQTIYAAYKMWCEQMNEYTLKARDFAKSLEERGLEKRNSAPNGSAEWHGIGLRCDYPNAQNASVTSAIGTSPKSAPAQEPPGLVSTEANSLLRHTEAVLPKVNSHKNLYRDLPESASVSLSASVASVTESSLAAQFDACPKCSSTNTRRRFDYRVNPGIVCHDCGHVTGNVA